MFDLYDAKDSTIVDAYFRSFLDSWNILGHFTRADTQMDILRSIVCPDL